MMEPPEAFARIAMAATTQRKEVSAVRANIGVEAPMRLERGGMASDRSMSNESTETNRPKYRSAGKVIILLICLPHTFEYTLSKLTRKEFAFAIHAPKRQRVMRENSVARLTLAGNALASSHIFGMAKWAR